jgi:hypothetical protein
MLTEHWPKSVLASVLNIDYAAMKTFLWLKDRIGFKIRKLPLFHHFNYIKVFFSNKQAKSHENRCLCSGDQKSHRRIFATGRKNFKIHFHTRK